MAIQSQAKAVPLEIRPLAASLGCSYQTLVRITGSFAEECGRMPWSFQKFGFVIFLRYRRHKRGKRCGHPQFYVTSRYAVHRIGGAPGRVRARLRQKTAAEWASYLATIKKLAWGVLIRGRERANDKHKGTHTIGSGVGVLARPPPPQPLKANRPAWRRFKKLALAVQLWYGRKEAPRAKLDGWLMRRFAEGHSRVRVMAKIDHALKVMPKGAFAPANAPAWLSAVAARHLDADGLGIEQRFRALRKRHGASAPTFNDEDKDSEIDYDIIDELGNDELS
jgi:hypothetical protein